MPEATQLQRCPACATAPVRTFHASRKTGRIVGACPHCGCHALVNPPSAEQLVDNHSYDREEWESWTTAKRHASLEKVYDDTLRRLDELIASGGRVVFDVGAGAGDFLRHAQQHGFEARGSELGPGQIEMAKELTGIDLHLGDLPSIDGANLFDAVTMWCVLAHVGDQDELLSNVYRLLKPGGVLFLQTPRWSAMDRAALGAARLSRGRFTRVLDRRVTDYHLTLNSVRSMSAQAERLGFEVLDIQPKARYSMQTYVYLTQLGLSERASRVVARAFDAAVDRDLFFRNVLDLYVRKPHH